MAKHLMVDLETLATSPDAAILTIGAVLFDPYSTRVYDKFYTRVNLESTTDLGMKIDEFDRSMMGSVAYRMSVEYVTP